MLIRFLGQKHIVHRKVILRGDIIDFFHRANIQNMQMILGFVEGDEAVIKQVNQRA